MVGWFAWAALVDDAGIRWLVGPLGQRWWTMRHPMVGWSAWAALVDDAASDGWLARPTTLVDDADPMVGWSAWAALVDDAASDTRTAQNSPRRGGRKGHPEIPRFSGSLFD
jgi:hypothetical protein